MKMDVSRKCCIFSLCAVLMLGFSCCTVKPHEAVVDFSSMQSFRDIPGLSGEEIAAIESLQKKYDSFVYGITPSTESFLGENGDVSGYAALFSKWLTGLFDIQFDLRIFEWIELTQKLNSGEVDFSIYFLHGASGEGNHKKFHVTDPIAERQFVITYLAGSRAIREIARERKPRYAFSVNSPTESVIASVLGRDAYETVWASHYNDMHGILERGEADALITTRAAEVNFIAYDDMVQEDFFPLTYIPVSMATANPGLEVIVSAINKALRSGAMDYLKKLYSIGYDEYRQYKFLMSLTEEEKEYLQKNTTIPLAVQYYNYPVVFYDKREKKWDGITIELLQEAEGITGLTFEVVNDENANMRDLMQMLLDGRAYIFSDLVKTEEREPFFLWGKKKLMKDQYVLLSKTSFPNVSINDIPYSRIALREGTAHTEMFRAWFPKAVNTKIYTNVEDAFIALEKDEVDLLMGAKSHLLYYSNYNEFSGYKANYQFNHFYETAFAFNRDMSVLCSIMDKALSVIDTNMIAEQWLTRTYDHRARMIEARFPLLIGTSILSVAVLLLILVIYFRTKVQTTKLQKEHERTQLVTEELNRQAIELIKAKNLAEQSNRSKSIFLSHMSHEIRTPMNAILGIAEIQLRDENLTENMQEAFGKIYESGDLLLNIINDLLDLSKIESGKLELSLAKYDIPSLINDTAQLNRLRFESNPILFTLHVDENTPIDLYGDELRIKQILNNILSNAFKYTDQGSIDFYVSADTEGDRQDGYVTLIFRVSDTGQGMTKDQVERIFEEYTRFNLDANRTTIGAGLGMSITKRLVTIMNGTIAVESEPGKGSVFTVRLPQKRIGTSVCGPELTEKLRNFHFQSTAISKKTRFIREYMPYGHVLVVDDVESNIFVTRGMLLPYGLRIETATSGIEVIDKVKNGNAYDIIFMDHMMPKMDGIEATKILRGMGYTNSIVALTANALVGRAEMFLKNGFDGFISKPIDSRELNFFLNDYIRNKKPPEVVEAARREQREKGMAKAGAGEATGAIAQDMSKSAEMINFFRQDAENALKVLDGIHGKIYELSDEDRESFVTTVHGMKSALANIGEKELSGMAFKLEQAGEENNLTVLTNVTTVFMDALRSLVVKFSTVGKDNEDVEITDADMEYLRGKLGEIKTASAAFDRNTVKTALGELKQKKWPSPINALLDDISRNILHSAFKKAVAVVEEYLQTNN